jgi:hypothetical protein
MPKNRQSLTALGAGLALFAAFTLSAQIPPKPPLRGHVPEAVARFHLPSTGRPAATRQLNLAIGLPLRQPQALDDLLREIYDPASPNYRQYLTPEQFTERFGPAEADYQALAEFMQANGLAVMATHPNRVVLDVRGSVADIERVFHVTLRNYAHPKEARDFYAPDAEPSLDLPVPVLHVSGLDNYALPHPAGLKKLSGPAAGALPYSGSGPGGTYRGNDFRAAYVPGSSLDGSGQMVGLVQFDGYYTNDIAAYISQAGLTNYPISLTNVAVNGGVGLPGSGNAEVALDIEMVISMAPGVSKIIVYEGPNGSTSWPTMLSRIANHNLAKQIGCSWGGGSPDPTSEQIFKQMASQGQSFFSASGDIDAFVGSIEFPSESTNITQVGGTTLSTTGAGGSYVSETVWNWGGGVGSSGGISTTYPIPGWQQGIDMTANHGSTTLRNMPDVALTGDNVYVTYNNGGTGTFGGTSCAAPLWAGFNALVNQRAIARGKPIVGFVNPAIYALGKGANYAANFHDITTGDNTWSGSPTNFFATSGYDLCTGWGTPNGTNLINALAGADDLGITPETGFTALGPVGGPFTATAQSYLLANAGGSPLLWSLSGKPFWLEVSSTSGFLLAGNSTAVTVSLNSAASNLLTGIYEASLTFSNLNSHLAQFREFIVEVGQPADDNGGFETGDLSAWTRGGSAASLRVVPAKGVLAKYVHSGAYGLVMGKSSRMVYLSQSVPTYPGLSYQISFWMNNINGHPSSQFLVNWNTNATSTNTIYRLANTGAIRSWTNLQFVVTATGTNATLQFGARNYNDYFGLDDIRVLPIPEAAIRSVDKPSGDAVVFSCNAITNLVYLVEYTTNLAAPDWVILSTNTATGSILTCTNARGADPLRFYRVRRMP